MHSFISGCCYIRAPVQLSSPGTIQVCVLAVACCITPGPGSLEILKASVVVCCCGMLQVVDNNNYGVKGWLCRNEHAGAFVGEQLGAVRGTKALTPLTWTGFQAARGVSPQK